MGDLFGNETESMTPKKRAAKKPKPETDGSVQRAIDRYHERFVAKFGVKPMINGRGAKHLKEMIATWGVDAVLDLIDRFFTSTNPRIVRGQYTLADLYANAHGLWIDHVRPDDRTVSNVDAAIRATRPRLVAATATKQKP